LKTEFEYKIMETERDNNRLRSRIAALTSKSAAGNGLGNVFTQSFYQGTMAERNNADSHTQGFMSQDNNQDGYNPNFCDKGPLKEYGVISGEEENIIRNLRRRIQELEAIAGTKEKLEFDLQDLTREIRQLKSNVSVLGEEKCQAELRLNEDQETLKEKHENEKRTLNADRERKIQDVMSSHQLEVNNLKTMHDQEKGYLDAQITGFHSQKSQLQGRHEAEKEKMSDDHEFEKIQLINGHDWKVNEIQRMHQASKRDMKQEHENKIGQMARLHESKQVELRDHISLMEEIRASEQERIRLEFADKELQLTTQISQIEKDRAAEIERITQKFEKKDQKRTSKMAQEEARLKEICKKKVADLEAFHAEDKERLRREVNAYSSALLARDDFKPMLDDQIKTKFLDIARDVDALARLEWKVDQKQWLDGVLQRLSANQRRLKKQILQDSIWVLLYEYIFCSPFRIFGEEGQSLEKQWSEQCGSSKSTNGDDVSRLDKDLYNWPKPEMKTERWRYVNVKECRTALMKPIPSEFDPLARSKKGFKISIDALKEKFKSMLGDLVNLDRSSIQAMEKLTIKAATMWLEFGMQRCRILVVLQGSNLKSTEEKKIQRARDGTLEMVVVPELKRIGNSKGQELNFEETIQGCEGETVEVSMRRGATN